MNHRIVIKNFGPIEEVEIEINKIVLLIGEQASGKSTVSKLIYFFKSLKEDLFALIFENLENENALITTLLIQEIKKKFYKYFGSTKHLPLFKIDYYFSETKVIRLTLNPQKYLHIAFDDDFFAEINDEFFRLIQAVRIPKSGKSSYDLIAIEQAKNRYLNALKDIVDRIFHDDKTSLFVPAGRNITVTYPEQFRLNFFSELSLESEKERNRDDRNQSVNTHLMIEFLKKIESIKSEFENSDFDTLIDRELNFNNITALEAKQIHKAKDLIFKILKGKYINDRLGEKIMYDTKKRRYVHLNNASSGQQESIRILQDLFLILLWKDNVFRVIEEPEAHLYPTAQKYLVELIAIAVNQSQSHIFITTHSPYILSTLNNLIYADIVSKDDKENVEKIIKPELWIDPKNMSAYKLINGTAHSLFDNELNLIRLEEIDDVSTVINEEFDNLFNLQD